MKYCIPAYLILALFCTVHSKADPADPADIEALAKEKKTCSL